MSDPENSKPPVASDREHHSDADASHEHDHEHIRKHIRAYLVVGVLLLVFTGLTVSLAFVDYGGNEAIEVGIALLLATLKSGLVAYIFMHLNSEKPLIYRIMLFTIIFFVALLVLIGFAYWNDIPALF